MSTVAPPTRAATRPSDAASSSLADSCELSSVSELFTRGGVVDNGGGEAAGGGRGGGGGCGGCGGVGGAGGGAGGAGGRGGGGGATASGTIAPLVTSTDDAAETTLTPRVDERADAGSATSRLAASHATLAVAMLSPGPSSGMMSMATRPMLAAERRSSTTHAGWWQASGAWRASLRLACCTLPKELRSPASVSPTSMTVERTDVTVTPVASGANGG